MAKINAKNLEKALAKKGGTPQISKEEEIGFHKGALTTLANERNELFKMMQNIEVIMQAHIKRLGELGVKIPAQKAK
jgi:hypothetical protein